jgi:hypothetical protein
MVSPTSQALQDPILLLPRLSFRAFRAGLSKGLPPSCRTSTDWLLPQELDSAVRGLLAPWPSKSWPEQLLDSCSLGEQLLHSLHTRLHSALDSGAPPQAIPKGPFSTPIEIPC